MAFSVSVTVLSTVCRWGDIAPDFKQLMTKYGHKYPPHKTKYDKLQVSGI